MERESTIRKRALRQWSLEQAVKLTDAVIRQNDATNYRDIHYARASVEGLAKLFYNYVMDDEDNKTDDPTPKNEKPSKAEIIAKLYKVSKAKSIQAFADELGLSRQYVSRCIKQINQ